MLWLVINNNLLNSVTSLIWVKRQTKFFAEFLFILKTPTKMFEKS